MKNLDTIIIVAMGICFASVALIYEIGIKDNSAYSYLYPSASGKTGSKKYPIYGSESLMSKKSHGTSSSPV